MQYYTSFNHSSPTFRDPSSHATTFVNTFLPWTEPTARPTGPTIVSMPALAQEAGWFSLFLVQAVVAPWWRDVCEGAVLGVGCRSDGIEIYGYTQGEWA